MTLDSIPMNPFPGLRPFRQDEDYLFFGREEHTMELLERLGSHRFVAVVGTSGSGKSSLVRCGLLSELQGGKLLRAGASWEIAVTHPGGNPLALLAEALLDAELYDPDEEDVKESLLATLSRSHLGLVEAVKQARLGPDANFLLVVDQFEELFRFHDAGRTQQDVANEFVSLLLEAVAQAEVPIYVVLTMRSDFIGNCGQFEGLSELVNRGEFLIPRLTREEYKRIIEAPIKVARGKIAPRLLQRLVNDLGQQADQLPCLQHALMRTWTLWSERGGSERGESDALDLEDYRRVGQMSKALSIHADEVYERLADDRERQICVGLFQALTVQESENRGIRRPQRLGDLCRILEVARAEFVPVIDAYRQRGVTFLMPPPEVELDDNTIIDISHESLMRVWGQLRGWVEEEAQAVGIYRRLSESAALCEEGKAGLYRDPELGIAASWRQARRPNQAWAERYHHGFERAMEFLEKSQSAARQAELEREAARRRELAQARLLAATQTRAARNFRRFSVGVGLVAALAIIASIVAVNARNAAERSESVARDRAAEAVKLRGVAEQARTELRQEFVHSDRSLAQSFVESGETGRAIAHLSRSLEPEYAPDSPGTIDRVCSILAHLAPPRELGPALDFGADLVYDSIATADAALIATADWISDDKHVRVWTPRSSEPLLPRINYVGADVWHRGLAFSPDGRFLFVGLTNASLGQLVDTTTWEVVREFPQTGIVCVQYSADGKRILTRSHTDPRAVVWNAETGEVISEPPTQAGRAIWSPDETKIASVGQVGLSILDLATGAVEDLSHEGHAAASFAVWSSDGRRILAPTSDEKSFDYHGDYWTLLVWDLTAEVDGEREPAFSIAHTATPIGADGPRYWQELVTSVYCTGAFSPGGERILTAGTDSTVRLWNAADGALLDTRSLPMIVRRESIPRFSADGQRVMLEFRDGTCSYAEFDPAADALPDFRLPPRPLQEGYTFLANRGVIRPLYFPLDSVTAAVVAADESAVVLGSARGIAGVYDTTSGRLQGALLRHAGEITSVAISSDGSRVATGSSFGTVRVWNAESSELLLPEMATGNSAEDGPSDLAFTAGGRELVVVDSEGTATLDLSSRASGTTRRRFRSAGMSATVSEDGEWVIVVDDGRVIVEKGSSGDLALRLDHDAPVTAAAISPDGSLVATATGDSANTVRVRAVATGESVGPAMEHDETVLGLDLRQDGRSLLTACASSGAHIWSLPTGASLDRLPMTGTGRCSRAVFSPDGRMVATVFEDGRTSFARVWESETGRPLTPPLSTGEEISAVEFLDDGGSLLVWAERKSSGIAAVWDVSVSEGKPSPDWFPWVAEALGGTRLDDESQPVAVPGRAAMVARVGQLAGETRLERFLKWLVEFPGTRADSPFRPRPTPAYISNLASAASFKLLEEGVRLSPRSARALALRACVRPGLETQPGSRTLSRADLIRAGLLAAGDDVALVAWATAIAFDRMSERAPADEAYARARDLELPDRLALDAILSLQERFATRNSERRHLLGRAIEAAEAEGGSDGPSRVTRLRAQRFRVALADEDFEHARDDWQILRDLSAPPPGIDFDRLLSEFLVGAERQAERLARAEKWDEAIALVRPLALVAEIERLKTDEPGADTYWQMSSLLAKLVEWENRDRPQNELVPMGSDWRFLDDGSDAGSAWRATEFDDAGWASGPARLGYGEGNEKTTVSYGLSPGNKFITTYFRRRFLVPESVAKRFAYIDLVRDDGAVVYVNGVEVLRSNMPAGPISYLAPSFGTVGEADETRAFRYAIDPAVLRPGENVIAAEVHQTNPTSSDLGFDLRLVLSAHSPSEYVETQLAGQRGAELLEEAAGIIPLPKRAEWKRNCSFAISREASVDADDLPDESWVRRFHVQASLGRWKSAIDTAERRIQTLAAATAPVEARQANDWLKRKEIALTGRGRPQEEIEAVRAAIFAAPPRDPSRDPKELDLSRYYNASLYDNRGWTKTTFRYCDLGLLPESFSPRHGLSFDIRGVIQLESGTLPDGDTLNSKFGNEFPAKVEGIAVGMASPAVHFLISCHWGRADPGDEIARLVMRYRDGTSEEMPVRYVEDIHDWWVVSGGARLPSSKVGWRGWIGGQQQEVALSELVWTNPHPDRTIESIDFVSTLGKAAPFLVGITLR